MIGSVHGGLDTGELRSLGLNPDEVLDFSANINPLGISANVKQAVSEADLSSYPDRHCLTLREAIADRAGVGIENLLMGNGSTELIHLLARACLKPGDRCLIFTPTFGEYEAAAVMAGGTLYTVETSERDGFQWSIDQASNTIRELRPRLVFLCNPNNPTGVYLERDAVEQIVNALGPHGLLVLDDAYAGLSDHQWNPTPLLGHGNVAILHSMTKDHALAGIRLGYLMASPDMITKVGGLQPAWSVNTVAQAAGLAALQDEAHVAAGRQAVQEAKAYLQAELNYLGIPTNASAANFILARVGDAPGLRSALLRRGIAVRDCTSFGLPQFVRIAARRRDECVRLVSALKEALAK